MMSEGFITTASLEKKITSDEIIHTKLQIEDMRINGNEEDDAITVFIEESGQKINFNLPQARMFAEAFGEILRRYPEKTESEDGQN